MLGVGVDDGDASEFDISGKERIAGIIIGCRSRVTDVC